MSKKISTLLDQYGNPIEYDVLDQEVASPSLGGLRSVLSSHPSINIDPYKLTRILRDAENGNADAYFDLCEDMEEKYLHYLGVLGTRKNQVSQLEISVNAASDEKIHQAHANLIRDWLNRDTLQSEVFDILDALGKGISYTEIIWDTSKPQWLPKQLLSRDPKWFTFDEIDGRTPLLKNESGLGQKLQPYKFIVHEHKGKSGLPIRGGLGRAVSWAYLFQNMSIKDWVIFAEVYGMPVRIGKYGQTATPQDKNTLLNAVTSIGIDAAAIIPESMQIEFANAIANGNAAVYKELAQYLDQQVSKAVLGQTATTDAVAGGLGGSQGNVHNDVRQDIQNADANLLASTLNRDLVRAIIDFNFGQPADGKYPLIKIGQADRLTAEQASWIEKFVPMGLKISQSVVRDKMGFEDPGEVEELLFSPQNQIPAKPPTEANEGQGGISGAKTKPLAFLGASYPSILPFSAAIKDTDFKNHYEVDDADAISAAIDKIDNGEWGGWEEVFEPIQEPIMAALAASNSFDEFRTKLIPILNTPSAKNMTELLAILGFQARANGFIKNMGE